MRVALEAFFIISWLIFMSSTRDTIWKKENENPTDGWTNLEMLQKQSKLSTGDRMMCEKLKHHLFTEELIYNRMSAIDKIFFLPCTIWVQRKSTSFLKIQFWTYVTWKRGRNFNIPNKLVERTMQQGYRPNLKGIGLLVIEIKFARKAQTKKKTSC